MPKWSMAPDGQFSDWASAQVWRTNTVYGWDYKYRINNNKRNVVYKCTAHLECFAQLNLHLVNEDSCVYIRYRGTHSSQYAPIPKRALPPNLNAEVCNLNTV